jgi:hypothetical protein
MPALEVDNAGLLRLVWSASGIPFAVNVLGISGTATSPVTQAKVNTLAVGIASQVTTSGLGAQQHPSITLSTIGVRNIDVPSQLELLGVFTPAVATGTGNALPPQTALVVTIRTTLAGPRFRGRSYIPGWADSANDINGTATAAARTAAGAFLTNVGSLIAGEGWFPAVISRPVYSTPPAIPPVLIRPGLFTNATAFVVRDLVWDTQRRRAIPGI